MRLVENLEVEQLALLVAVFTETQEVFRSIEHYISITERSFINALNLYFEIDIYEFAWLIFIEILFFWLNQTCDDLFSLLFFVINHHRD